MDQATAEPVELPDDEHVAASERSEAGLEARPLVAGARGAVVVDVGGVDAGAAEGVALQVKLRACAALGTIPDVNRSQPVPARPRDWLAERQFALADGQRRWPARSPAPSMPA